MVEMDEVWRLLRCMICTREVPDNRNNQDSCNPITKVCRYGKIVDKYPDKG